jgi:hypothetical protein
LLYYESRFKIKGGKFNGKSKNNLKLNQNGWLKNSPTWRSLKNKNVKDKDRQELQEIKSWSRLKKKPSLNGGGFLLKGVGVKCLPHNDRN